MQFVGLDLAWSEDNPSALVVLDWKRDAGVPVTHGDALGDNGEILSCIAESIGEDSALVAVDAPLVVPNERGTRPCDRDLSRVYRSYQAGAYPANRRRFRGRVRGEELVARLGELGFRHSPDVPRQAEGRQVVEVYPHPALVELFGLETVLKYKARPERSYELRWKELNRLRELLRSLSQREPALHAAEWLDHLDPMGLRGKALKRLEDLLDALFCSYIAVHLWYWGRAGYRCFGNLETGYVLVPIRPSYGDPRLPR